MPSPEGLATRSPVYVGIDVAKDHLDVALLPSGQAWRVANDPDGIDLMVSRLTESRASLVVMEGTGGHEHAVAAALASAGLPIAVVNPRSARRGGAGSATSPRLPASSRRPTPSTPA